MRESLTPGVWGVVATPFQGSTLDVDADSLAELVAHYESIGATGLTVLGVFGEAARLTATERRQVLEMAVEDTAPAAGGRRDLASAPARPIEEIRRRPGRPGDRLAAVMVQANSPRPAWSSRTCAPSTRPPAPTSCCRTTRWPAASRISTEALISRGQACRFVTAVKAEAPPTPPGDRDT